MNEQQFEAQQSENQITAPKKKSALLTAGFVLGIIGICTSFIPIVNNASFALGILAVIFGAIGLAKRMGKAKAITALVLGILSIVITFAMQEALSNAIDDAFDELDSELGYIAGDKTDEVLDKYLTVKFGQFTVIEDEYFDETEMSVTVTNKSDEKKSFSITVEAVDKDGNRIDTDIIYANDLAAGQGQSFKIFQFVTSDNIEAMKNATFRVAEASMY